ncbi:hypothetical protein CHLNCDRAFT_143317 [Chlorella variabilis]|uniref:Fungal lipase-type domain-containing protein n=1 Tax=Chlorella variabilis TaxID=554065 RepID=E1Z9Y7_CHLVA|nr:hypothetical protein CHLNCDRAFT_143317 [Chlorella variabilis]EFN57857.1 hypothetical protein CHLNCDRAFT_143317 [Chlorella variabilis]|eukprot:XP_005849959.1 hypothetical protein CHLNCDRAFT_143317 [Chlorella variabilis]
MQFLQNASALADIGVRVEEVPVGESSQVTLFQALPGEVVLVFEDASLTSTASWADSTARVPFLQPFVYTSQAPTALLDSWAPLSEGNSTAGELSETISAFMEGEEVVRVICVGEGPSGGLAVLCGPWAALQYPEANVDVVTFDTPFVGFNPQFAWSFEQLVVLHYMWPFAVPATTEAGVLAAAQAVNLLITKDILPGAVRLPNLPPYAPVGIQDPGNKNFSEVYAMLGPDPTLPEEYQLPPSDCPVMFCKTRPLLEGSCLSFDNETILGGLPYTVLTDDKTDADAIVAWDNTTKTAHFLWKYTEESRDWFTDANGIQLTGDVEVHAGFYNQFKSLAIFPDREEDSILKALESINGAQFPRRVTCSGFSLGAALSEMCGVWSSILFPGADVLGGPIPGNEEFKLAFETTVGRAYKYVYRMDLVPSTAPFSWYKRDRPEWGIGDLSWNDHTCDTWVVPDPAPGEEEIIIGYVPRLYEITRPTVPAWVFNYTAPVETPKPGATSAAARLAWPTTALLASAAAWLAAL